jgi:hypothetical protein
LRKGIDLPWNKIPPTLRIIVSVLGADCLWTGAPPIEKTIGMVAVAAAARPVKAGYQTKLDRVWYSIAILRPST